MIGILETMSRSVHGKQEYEVSWESNLVPKCGFLWSHLSKVAYGNPCFGNFWTSLKIQDWFHYLSQKSLWFVHKPKQTFAIFQ